MQAILDQFEIGQEYPCWYDPIDPHRVVLVRGYSPWLYVSLLIPLSFMIIGGGRLIYTLFHWNTSDERRALLTQRAAQLDLFEVETERPRISHRPDRCEFDQQPRHDAGVSAADYHERPAGRCSPPARPACCGTAS